MDQQLELYVSLIYFLAALPYIWLGLYAWRKRPAVAVTPFAWAMLSLSIWSFTYGLGLLFPTLSDKLFIAKIEAVGVIALPVFIFIFAIEFTGNSHLLTWRKRFLLWIVPILILILIWTNESHHLMWDKVTLTQISSLTLVDAHYRLPYWVSTVYSSVLVLLASILLSMEILRRPSKYRFQISFVILGILTPWVGNLIFVSSINPVPNLDISPLLFLPTGLGLAWAITRYGLLEIIPLEHLTVLKNMKDGVIVVNSSERVLYINPLAEKLLERSETDVIGQPLNRISRKHGRTLSSYLTGKEHQAEIMIELENQARVYEVTVSQIETAETSKSQVTPDNMIVLHDITQRKEEEIAISRRESIMSAISITAEQFLKESTWESHVSDVLQKIGQAVDASRVQVFMNYTDENQILYSSLCYEWTAFGITAQKNNPDLQHVDFEKAGFQRWKKALSQNLLICGLVEEFPESEQTLFRNQGSVSIVATPIFVEKQWWGFILFDECRNKRNWTDIEIKALRTTASIFGSAESRSRAEKKLIGRQQTLELLQEIVQTALQSKDLPSMAQSLVGRLTNLINADGCFITEWDDLNKIPHPLATSGSSGESYLHMNFEPGKLSFAESAFKLGHTLIVEDISTSPYADKLLIQRIYSASMIVVPMISGVKQLGTIVLLFDSYHRFQPEEISISEQAANLIALAFEKFQAVEQAQRRANTSETLRKASAAITETLEMESTVTKILEQLNQVVPYDSASVQLLDGNELQIVGGRGWDNPDDIMGMRFKIPGDNPNTKVMETGKPYIFSDIQKFYKAFRDEPQIHINSWLGVPLIFQERIIGLLAIDSSEPNHFTEEDINLASVFADQVAVSLKNASVFKEFQDQAITDPLTGLYNRRGLFELGRVDFARSISSDRPISGIMIDIDHFKQINDTYGHESGDAVLRELAKLCKKCVREIDYVNRYGGEEILIILPETNLKTALIVAERLRTTIFSQPIKIGEGLDLSVTASLGVAQRDEYTTNLEMLISRADQAMYTAKHKGRNRVAMSV